jgi:mannan endo-1,4-beta-mannosidase
MIRAIVFLALVCASMNGHDERRRLSLKLGSEGDIYAWLVAGPFPDPGAFQLHGSGFANDLLGSEPDAKPVEGQPSGERRWKLLIGDRFRGVDLIQGLGDASEAIGYCYTELDSPSGVDARLLFGSDDGAKVFLNGQMIYSRESARGVKRDEDEVRVQLRQGRNRLLFKVEQLNQGWGIMARIVDDRGQPLPGLVESVSVDPAVSDDYRPMRSVAGTDGALDIDALRRYDSISRRAARWIHAMRSEAVDPAALDAALSAGAGRVTNSQVSAGQLSLALMESAKTIEDAYGHSRSKLLAWAQDPGPLFPVKPPDEDFIKVLPGGRYFAHADGRPFIPIGYNHNPDWPQLAFGNPLAEGHDPTRVEAWFANLSKHGVDVVRLMAGTPPTGDLEERPGVFEPEHVIWLDSVFEAARRNHVRLWVTPYDTFWMNRRPDTCCYWAANGGPIRQPIDFLTKPELIDLEKKRMKFLIDRYGNSDTVFAWEIMNEVDLWWGASPAQISAWTDQMASFVRDYQRRKWGREHLLTISFAEAEPKGLNAVTAFQRPDLDFATMHLYLGASRGPSPGQAEQAGLDFAVGVRYARAQLKDNRPVMDGESGPIDRWIADERFDEEVFHDMSWEHLMNGGAGSGTRWPYRNPHHLTEGMLNTLKSMRLFCDGVPWNDMTGPETGVSVAAGDGAKVTSFGTAKGVIAWVRASEAIGKSLRIAWPDGREPLHVRLFDVEAGRWLEGTESPGGVREVAVWASSGR